MKIGDGGPIPGTRNILLTGFMGSGKTIVGRILGKRLGWRFVDTDDLIRERAGRDIPGIFEREGEGEFRKLERDAIASLSGASRMVIATGGGAVLDPGNMEALRSLGPIVWLRASEQTILDRVGPGDERPLLAGAHSAEERCRLIRDLLGQREEAYAKADIAVDTENSEPSEVAMKVLRALEGLAARFREETEER
jgi:shikimate kinase